MMVSFYHFVPDSDLNIEPDNDQDLGQDIDPDLDQYLDKDPDLDLHASLLCWLVFIILTQT